MFAAGVTSFDKVLSSSVVDFCNSAATRAARAISASFFRSAGPFTGLADMTIVDGFEEVRRLEIFFSIISLYASARSGWFFAKSLSTHAGGG